jgi:hypothetical protein
MSQSYSSFKEFYPFYLSQHSNPTCRRLHYIGTASLLVVLIYAFNTERWSALWFLPVVGYGFAWVGHFVFEKNRPATFQHPIYSLMGDFVMFKDILIGKIKF